MKILALSDVEEPWLYEYLDQDRLNEADLIISCGDLSADYLEFIVTMARVPLLYVPGNHDGAYLTRAPGGCTSIDGRLWEGTGLRVFGMGGAMRYRVGPFLYSEAQMRRRMRKLKVRSELAHGIDILVTHAPPRGYGDLDDLAHHGFEAFNETLNQYRPTLMLHGHIHMQYGRIQRELIHPSGARIINVCGSQLIEFPTGTERRS